MKFYKKKIDLLFAKPPKIKHFFLSAVLRSKIQLKECLKLPLTGHCHPQLLDTK